MKKSISFFAALLIASAAAFAQKCKPVQDQKDEFTGVQSVFWGGTVREDLMFTDKDRTVALYFGKYGDSLQLQMHVTYLVSKDNIFKYQEQKECLSSKKGNQLFISLEKDKRIQLTALQDSKISKKKILSSLQIFMYVNYSMSKADYDLLCANNLSKIRIDLDECEPIVFEVRDNKKETFLKLFNCAKERLFGGK